jgi:hypothetical protein
MAIAALYSSEIWACPPGKVLQRPAGRITIALMPTRRLYLSVALSLLACGEPEPPTPDPDSGPPSCESTAQIEIGDANGHAEPLGAPAGQARAGRLTAAQLPADRTSLATWEAGDFVLANDRMALIIEDAGASDLYDPHGGRPVGVALVEGGALVDAGDFNEILFGFGGSLVATESVTVLNDGSNGEPAVIRAAGPLAPLEFAGELLSAFIPAGSEDGDGIPAAMDYTLAPGGDRIDVAIVVAPSTPRIARAPFMLSAFFQRYRMPMWTAAEGFAAETFPVQMASFVDDGGASYAWLAPEEGELSRLIDTSGVLILSSGRPAAPGCQATRIEIGSMIIGGPGLSGLQRALAENGGQTVRTITGTVREDDDSIAEGVRIHVKRADGTHFARVTPAEDGTFSISAPNEAVELFAFREGTGLVGPIAVPAAQNEADVTMPPFATISVVATDADLAVGLPVRIQVIPTADAPSAGPEFGERGYGDRAHVHFSGDGTAELKVDPGEHRIIVSHGYEYEIRETTTMLDPGERFEFEVGLERTVQTPGVMCADYHIHTHRSPDSPDSPVLKVLGLVADGLEIPIRSDHEWVNDFQPLIEELGVDDWAFGIGGEELTTFAWGHFGVFPLVEDESVNGSAVPWVGMLPPAVFDAARARPEQPVVIINHPRSGGSLGGYFAAAGYDNVDGTVVTPALWDEEFTLVEVFNDDDFDSVRDGTVADWFSLLNFGRPIFAVGSSDSHGIFGSPVGYPRTCLNLGTDDPHALTADLVRDATAQGHSVISGGLYMTVEGPGGEGPGDRIAGAGENAIFQVTVQAASWIRGVSKIEVFVDGVEVQEIDITEDSDPLSAVHFSGEIEVPVATDGTWVVFHAGATEDLSPIHPGSMPFAASNPIFLTR